MKSLSALIILSLIAFQAMPQEKNRKPKIVGQDQVSTNEDESVTILMQYLDVEDPDDWFYPWGFSMQLYPGDNYTYNGNVVTPAADFSGKLIVKVSVNDGEDESNKFDLEITVNSINDKPIITGNAALSIKEGETITIISSHLTVKDPDDKYPEDFTLHVLNGNNYTLNGNQVIPQTGFAGTLSVNVSVNDGTIESDAYVLPITINAVNRVPVITGQATLQVNEDQSLTLLLSHFTVEDGDNNYPEGFTLSIGAGNNYSFSNATITPSQDFFGRLSVSVTVNDGKNASKPFDVAITVTPVDDPPVIANLETEPLYYRSPDESVSISQTLTIMEADGDSIMFAEVGFLPGTYQATVDQLDYTQAANGSIRGVFDQRTGILTLLGQASPIRYAEAIRSVKYSTLVPASAINKKLHIVVNDGKSDSEAAERDLVFGQAVVSLDIPTGFTPNGDLSNDTWKIIPLKTEDAYTQAHIRVYNKDGIVVYETIGFQNEWDGKVDGELLPADTYFYTIDLNINAPEGYLKGLVTILR
jgi:gliding motility-associated-like protein